MGAVPNVRDFHLCSDLKFASFPKTDFPVSVCVYESCLLFRSPFNADSSVSLSSLSPVTFIFIGPYFGLWVGTIMTQEDFVEDKFLYRVSSGVQDQGCWGAHLWTGFWCNRNLSCVCVPLEILCVALVFPMHQSTPKQWAGHRFIPATFSCNNYSRHSTRFACPSCVGLCVESWGTFIHLYICTHEFNSFSPIRLVKIYKIFYSFCLFVLR